LITNEYAAHNRTRPDAVQSPIWDVTSGSLYATQGKGATNSSVFRMTTKRRDFLNVAVTFELNNQGLTPDLPREDWDGVHIFCGTKTNSTCTTPASTAGTTKS
jgi:hypothetical protein